MPELLQRGRSMDLSPMSTAVSEITTRRTTCMTDRLVDAGAGAAGVSLRPLRVARLVTLATIALLVFGVASASASQTHVFSASFGSSGSGAGQVSAPSGVAVNVTTHDVYVADTGNFRVDQFSSGGSFIRAWGWGVADGLPALETCTLSCQAGLSGTGAGQFTTPTFIAVDNSAGASAGDVYIGDTATNQVQKFSASGSLITAWGSGGQLDGSTATHGPFGALAGIAVDTTAGDLNVFDTNTRLFRFAQDGSFTTDFTTARGTSANGFAIDGSGNFFKVNGDPSVEEFQADGTDIGQVTVSDSTTGVTADTTTGDLYVDLGASIEHYTFPACVPADAAGCNPADTFGSGHLTTGVGLATDPSTGTVYAADRTDGQIVVFAPVTIPDTVTNPVTAVTKHTAALNGHLDPAGGPDTTDCHFQYADDASFQANGFTGATVAPCAEGDSFSAPADVHADVTGLAAQTTYHVRLIVQSPNGTNTAAELPFTTPAAVDLTLAPAGPVGTTTATLGGHVDSGGGGAITDCHFEYADDASFQANGFTGATQASCSPATPISASADVSADLTGLTAETTYHVRLVATNSDGTTNAAGQPFTTFGLPVVHAAFVSDLTTTEADLNAQLSPRGQLTDCRFDWGTDTSYGASEPCSPAAASIAADASDHLVTTHLSGLTANTTYHWRVVAISNHGTTVGGDHTFAYSTTGQGLTDGRAYEMVTPPQKNGALIGVVFAGSLTSVSQDGSRVIAPSVQCFADSGSCNANRALEGTPYSLARSDSGWTAHSLSPSSSELDSNTPWTSSADLGTALFSAPSPPAGQDNWYIRASDGSLRELGPILPPSRPDVAPASGIAATADYSHLVYMSAATSSGGAQRWPFDQSTSAGLYEYVGTDHSQPFMVAVSGGADSTDLLSTCGNVLGGNGPGVSSAYNPMSADGRTVFFTAQQCASGSGANASTSVPADTLYARVDGELPSAHTVAISERSAAACTTAACLTSSPANALFQGASADGSRVFFSSTQQLTDQATQASQNLYLYDFSRPAGNRLTAVASGDPTPSGPRVEGVEAISADGSHVYFAAKGVLTPAPNAYGQTAHSGDHNLYVYDAVSGSVDFIVALPDSDSQFDFIHGNNITWAGFQGGVNLANVTPGGRFLVFMSHAALTPDGTASHAQVFRYDAQTGQLIRISVGEHGFNDNGNAGADSATILPLSFGAGSVRADPTMSHDGSYVFFESPAALTPGALDNVVVGTLFYQPQYAQNVYEWHEGKVSLISDGRDASAIAPPGGNNEPTDALSSVALLGVDATGQNVFFSTTDRLVGQDTDTQLDFYDARVGGGIPYAPPPEPCQGDSCKSPPSGVPLDPSPASADFNGPGNQVRDLAGTIATPSKKTCQKRKTKTCKKQKVKKQKVKKQKVKTCKKQGTKTCKKSRKSNAREANATGRSAK
ncbi:hypothetical protein [Baekduia sp.]|uniref:hypothetical protein n=1 Tax=Baekduia sp. TaxID=2600305 RepID=UPI002DFCAE8F|nr:hypothetical protein [Baekduia sp.]